MSPSHRICVFSYCQTVCEQQCDFVGEVEDEAENTGNEHDTRFLLGTAGSALPREPDKWAWKKWRLRIG